MILERVAKVNDHAWKLVARLGASDGSAAHPHVRRLMVPDAPVRDLCDAVHLLCAVHGHHPGLVAEALDRHPDPDARDWLAAIADAFVAERTTLVTASATMGPQPSTPGQGASEAAIAGIRRALEMLGRSERRGCALGAAAVLVLDWPVLRVVVEQAALRSGLAIEPTALPPVAAMAAALSAIEVSPPAERAIGFGAQQLLHQHRGLWDLLEARAAARARG